MLLELACADAYGIAFEFVKDHDAHGLKNDLTFQQNPRYPELRPSQYTDDTLRSIATFRALMSAESSFDPTTYGDYILRAFALDKRKGWSKNFQSLLASCDGLESRDFLNTIRKRASSNGSVMGCLPCGMLRDPVEVRHAATAQAIATHDVTTAPYAQALALAAHYYLYDLGSPKDLLQFVNDEAEGFELGVGPRPLLDYIDKPVSMSAEHTATAVFALLDHCVSLSQIMREAVSLRGDTDSVAALAVGIASCSADYENDIPHELIATLDGGHGASLLRSLDNKLMEFVNDPSHG